MSLTVVTAVKLRALRLTAHAPSKLTRNARGTHNRRSKGGECLMVR